MNPLRTLLLSSFHAIVREIRLQADRQIGTVCQPYLAVLLDIQGVVAVNFCTPPDTHHAIIFN